MYYVTHDADGKRIMSDANIRAFPTREEAETYLRAPYGSEWDQDSIKIEAGNWSDCWIKAMSKPDAHAKWLDPFSLDECIVQRPGSHPGGRAWWITPSTDVLVVTAAREVE